MINAMVQVLVQDLKKKKKKKKNATKSLFSENNKYPNGRFNFLSENKRAYNWYRYKNNPIYILQMYTRLN